MTENILNDLHDDVHDLLHDDQRDKVRHNLHDLIDQELHLLCKEFFQWGKHTTDCISDEVRKVTQLVQDCLTLHHMTSDSRYHIAIFILGNRSNTDTQISEHTLQVFRETFVSRSSRTISDTTFIRRNTNRVGEHVKGSLNFCSTYSTTRCFLTTSNTTRRLSLCFHKGVTTHSGSIVQTRL